MNRILAGIVVDEELYEKLVARRYDVSPDWRNVPFETVEIAADSKDYAKYPEWQKKCREIVEQVKAEIKKYYSAKDGRKEYKTMRHQDFTGYVDDLRKIQEDMGNKAQSLRGTVEKARETWKRVTNDKSISELGRAEWKATYLRAEEDFKTDFCSSMLDLVYGQTVCDLRSFIAPYRRQIRQKVALLEQLAKQLRSGDREKVLCHTDIHTGNLITLKDGFVLIDWEGLKFAPPEADLFCIFSYPWKDIFFERYLKRRQNIRIDQAGILFYQTRRVLEDIFEFAEQLQFETMTPAKRSRTFCFLKELCEAL